MKNCNIFRKSILFVGMFFPFLAFSQDLRSQADDFFRKGNYYDAFFLYRNLLGEVVATNEPAQKCSHAMALTKQFKDLKSINKTTEAKSKLKELIFINPEDFHKNDLVRMTLDEANNLQKMAFRQQTAEETNLMLDEAISRFQESQSLGWQGGEVDNSIQQCLAAKKESEKYINIIQEDLKMLKIRNIEPIRKAPIVVIIPNKF